MAVAVVMKFEGATTEQYDEVIKMMGLTPGGATATGGLFHWVAKTDTGLKIVDVWPSREQFEKFAQEEIGPITEKAGFPSPPEMQFYELHNYLSAK